MTRRLLPRLAAAALLAALAAPVGRAAPGAVALTLQVTFAANGTITVTLPDGTPVGTTSGAPTVIPAGYYTLELVGPGACTALPLFELVGPGVDLYSDMTAGEENYMTQEVYLRPSSTYTWRNEAVPGVVHTFVTTATAQGTVPTPTPPGAAKSSATVSSSDIVGSAVAPFRGRLTAVLSASGHVTLTYRGAAVRRLPHGRYTVRVTDRSATSGLALRKGARTVALAGTRFVGTRSASVVLTPGRWSLATRAGSLATIVVR